MDGCLVQDVRRHAKELQAPQLAAFLGKARSEYMATRGLTTRATTTKDGGDSRSDKHQSSNANLLSLCHQLGRAIEQCCETAECCQSCLPLLRHEVSQGFFLNLLVVWLSSVARLYMTTRFLGLRAYELYKLLTPHLLSPESSPSLEVLQAKVAKHLRPPMVCIETEASTAQQTTSKDGPHHDGPEEDLGSSLGRVVAPPAGPSAAIRPQALGAVKEARRAVLACEYSSSEDEDDNVHFFPPSKKQTTGDKDERARLNEIPVLPFFIDTGVKKVMVNNPEGLSTSPIPPVEPIPSMLQPEDQPETNTNQDRKDPKNPESVKKKKKVDKVLNKSTPEGARTDQSSIKQPQQRYEMGCSVWS